VIKIKVQYEDSRGKWRISREKFTLEELNLEHLDKWVNVKSVLPISYEEYKEMVEKRKKLRYEKAVGKLVEG
jgi:hypothetical protein